MIILIKYEAPKFYIGIIIVIVGIIGMIIQGKFKKVIEFIIEYF